MRRNQLFLWIFLFVAAPVGAAVVVCVLLLFGVSAHSVFAPGRAVQTFLHAPRAVGVLVTVALWWAIVALLGLAWEWRGRRIARVTYQRLWAPFGSRAVERMLRDGLPPQLAPALRFLFSGKAPAAAEDVALRIERRRDDIAARPDVYRFAYFDSSLGTVRLAEPAGKTDGALTSHWLATTASVPRRWGMFLHLCAEGFDARVILEMGACLGISGSYLAAIPSRPHLLTLEGSQPLSQIARMSIAAVSDNVDVVVGPFEQTLSGTLNGLTRTIDVAYVDGHHEEAATLHYVAMIAAHLSPTALIVLDDIYLYEGMWRAWQTLSAGGDLIAVNVGRFGLLVYGMGSGRYDLARYTGRWRVGGTRARAMRYDAP